MYRLGWHHKEHESHLLLQAQAPAILLPETFALIAEHAIQEAYPGRI
jgi:hypothetical protein